jgi:GDP-mannose 6-dehydrogenase
VVGLGHAGLATAAGFLQLGARVLGVEVSAARRAALRAGTGLIESDLQPVLAEALADGRLQLLAPESNGEPVDFVCLCVQTPVLRDGDADLRFLKTAFAETVQKYRAARGGALELVVRSTVPPGVCGSLAGSAAAQSRRVTVVHWPEFMREGHSLADFFDPSLCLVGLTSTRRPRRLFAALATAKLTPVMAEARATEMLKLCCNAFHALKVSFANEAGRLAAGLGINGPALMGWLASDTRLNASAAYLRPGWPFGGACLEKDTRMLADCARKAGLRLPLVENTTRSNRDYLRFLAHKIVRSGRGPVAVLGVTTKSGLPDLRHSPAIALAGELVRLGVRPVRLFDAALSAAQLHAGVPELQREARRLDIIYADTLPEAMRGVRHAVLFHQDGRYRRAIRRAGLPVFDPMTGAFG